MIIVGIDPGATGAIVSINNSHDLEWYRFKDTDGFSISCILLKEFIENIQRDTNIIYLEKVHSMPGEGVTSVFTFGRSVGVIEGMLKQESLKYHNVLPQDWQRELGLVGIAGKNTFKNAAAKKTFRKKAYLEYAKKLFPKYANQITIDLADAILIAEFGYRKELKNYDV